MWIFIGKMDNLSKLKKVNELKMEMIKKYRFNQ